MMDLDLVTDGWWEWDLVNPDYEYMSPKFWTTIGYNPADMPHSPSAWKDIIHPEDRIRAEAAFLPHVEQGEPYHLLVRYRHASGHWVWIVCRGQVVFEDGVPVKMVGAHQNVTAVVQERMPEHPHLREASTGMLESMERIMGILGGSYV